MSVKTKVNGQWVVQSGGLSAPSSSTVFATIPNGLSMGDVTGNGTVDAEDAAIISAYLEGTEIDTSVIKIDQETVFAIADINGNGTVDEEDYMAIGVYALGDLAGIMVENEEDYTAALNLYCENARDYYGNWSWDTQNHYYYYDVPVNGVTANSSALITLDRSIDGVQSLKAKCLKNIIRFYIKACPVEPIDCAITYAPGNGNAIIRGTNPSIYVKQFSGIAEIASMDFSSFKAGDIVLAYSVESEVSL